MFRRKAAVAKKVPPKAEVPDVNQKLLAALDDLDKGVLSKIDKLREHLATAQEEIRQINKAWKGE